MKHFSPLIRLFYLSKRTITIALCLSLVYSLPFIMAVLSKSFVDFETDEAQRVYGRFDNILYGNTVDSLTGADGRNVNSGGYIKRYGEIRCVPFENGLTIGTADEAARELGGICVTAGTYPENSDEICICASTYYESYYQHTIGDTIIVNGRGYILSGLMNDYPVAWNKLPNGETTMFPDAFTAELETGDIGMVITLIQNSRPFPEELYRDNRNLVANTNVRIRNTGGKYNAPDFLYAALYTSVALITFYAVFFISRRDLANAAILRRLGVSPGILQTILSVKCLTLPASAACVGRAAGEGIARIFIWIDRATGFASLTYPEDIVLKPHFAMLLLLSVAAGTGYLIFHVVKKRMKEKMAWRKRRISKRRGIYYRELRGDCAGILLTAAVCACLLVSSLILETYLSIYKSQRREVFGKVPLDYDYQFTTNQEISNDTYVDSNGNKFTTASLPDKDSVYFMPDHSNIIRDEILAELRGEEKISRVDSYLEANDVYVKIPDMANQEYLEKSPSNQALDAEIMEQLSLQSDGAIYMSSQFCGFPEDKIAQLKPYVREGEINTDKINGAEEVILIVPIFEYTSHEDGSATEKFIPYSDYKGKSNQFMDQTFRAGDSIDLLQIVPRDKRDKGYFTLQDLKERTSALSRSVKIGAVVYEHVMWFDDVSQPPGAYTFIGTQTTLQKLGIQPTFSRAQVFLKEGVSYSDFEPVIHAYQYKLSDFIYRNNAAEMEEYRRFLIVLRSICGILSALAICIMLIITATEAFLSYSRRREYYTSLRILGMPPSVYCRMILCRTTAVCAVALFVSLTGGLSAAASIFGSVSEISRYMGTGRFVFGFVWPLGLMMLVTFLVYSPMMKKYVS